MTHIILLALLLPLLGTVIGASFSLWMRGSMHEKTQKGLLGFASGVMIAASFWSLLLPALDFNPEAEGLANVWQPAIGFLCGMGFLLLIDYITPHLHLGDDKPEGLTPKKKLSRTTMLSLSVAIHNLPEGMAVGVVLASVIAGEANMEPAAAIAMAIGIGIQNIPEGAIISMPMRAEGNSRLKSFGIGALSGIVEPIGAVLVILLTAWLTPVMPGLLAFAAGAMIYVVVEELIPEANTGEHSNVSTIGFALGFVLMMILDNIN